MEAIVYFGAMVGVSALGLGVCAAVWWAAAKVVK